MKDAKTKALASKKDKDYGKDTAKLKKMGLSRKDIPF
jgi:hypothetical protein